MPPKGVHVAPNLELSEDIPVEAEPDDYDGQDSAYGDGEPESSTTSMRSSILKFREENGRTYHSYKEGKYVLPNDEDEKDRLDLQHHLFSLTFDGKLTIVPIPKEKTIHRVLDVGTGTGIWAIDWADEHPGSHVIGVDLSPIQPVFVPPNLSFEIDDLEEDWTFSKNFDFIHARMMVGSFADWPKFFAQSFEFLNPGGYIEVTDICFPGKTDDNSWPENSALRKWNEYMLQSCHNLGRFSDSPTRYKSQLLDAGFIDVVEVQNKWPQNRWPKDKKLKELGMWNRQNIGEEITGMSMALFTRGLGWTPEEVTVFAVDVRKEFDDTKIHAYWPIYTVYAKKPEEAT